MACSTKPSGIIITGCPPVGKSGSFHMAEHRFPTGPAPGCRAGQGPRAGADLDREVNAFDG